MDEHLYEVTERSLLAEVSDGFARHISNAFYRPDPDLLELV
jgi:hypothetical protein